MSPPDAPGPRPAGYSGTPLARKLGIRTGFRVKTGNAPPGYERLLEPIPERVAISNRLHVPVDLWHLFVTRRRELSQRLARCLEEITPDGMIWISWPKRSSGVSSDVTEAVIREVALPLGLVDVKVCAVDEVWSGLKLVIRRANRRQRSAAPPPPSDPETPAPRG